VELTGQSSNLLTVRTIMKLHERRDRHTRVQATPMTLETDNLDKPPTNLRQLQHHLRWHGTLLGAEPKIASVAVACTATSFRQNEPTPRLDAARRHQRGEAAAPFLLSTWHPVTSVLVPRYEAVA
jgi:hypothetical protein